MDNNKRVSEEESSQNIEPQECAENIEVDDEFKNNDNLEDDDANDLGINYSSNKKDNKNKTRKAKNGFISKNIDALKSDIRNLATFLKRVIKPLENESRGEVLKSVLKKDSLISALKRPLSIITIAIIALYFLYQNSENDKTGENKNLKSLQENQTKIREIAQKDATLNEISDAENKEIEKERNKSIEAEKEMFIMENNATATAKKASQDIARLDWNKRVMKFFINEKDIKFNLIENGDRIAVIMDNFKQEPENQNRITGIDARVSKIVLTPSQSNDFLDILLEIESIPPTAHYVLQKRYPLLNHIKLNFYDDSIVKTTNAGETILTIGDKILPYMTIKNIGRVSSNKIFTDIEINQSYFGGENFTYHYETFE